MAEKVVSLAGLRNVQAMLAEAEPVVAVLPVDPRPGEKRGGVPPGDWQPDALGLPEDCPVSPLGVSGSRMWFLNTINQVEFLDPPYGKGAVLGLFGGRLDYLKWAWPRFGKDKVVAGFENDEVGAALIRACKAKGPWDPGDGERWLGCWTDAGGNLVVHVGHQLVTAKGAVRLGEFDGVVYPARQRILAPWPLRDELPFNAAQVLRPVLRTWSWSRPEIDPHLLLGWIGAAFLGAALPWRPLVFLTGGKGTGKSHLQGLLKAIFGSWLLSSADTTAAGVYQRLGLSSLPIAIDELESEADSRKAVALLKLARLASSGADMARGSSDHKAMKFSARSAFLFSSINAPPMRAQDLSRMALLRLDKLPAGQKAPQIDGRTFGLIGRCILRRLIEEWPRFEATCEAFAGELGAAGMDQRGQAQFGTLLACADMIEHSGWDESRLRFALEADGDLVPWRELLRPSAMPEMEDGGDNWLGCLSHLLGVRVEAWRNGTRQTVGEVVQGYFETGDPDIVAANRELAQAGLRIVFIDKTAHLLVHNNGPLVRQLFMGSDWEGLYGAGTWSGALRQSPAHLWRLDQRRINGVQAKGTAISLEGLYGKGGVMAEETGENGG
jgi:hypothetical protein